MMEEGIPGQFALWSSSLQLSPSIVWHRYFHVNSAGCCHQGYNAKNDMCDLIGVFSSNKTCWST